MEHAKLQKMLDEAPSGDGWHVSATPAVVAAHGESAEGEALPFNVFKQRVRALSPLRQTVRASGVSQTETELHVRGVEATRIVVEKAMSKAMPPKPSSCRSAEAVGAVAKDTSMCPVAKKARPSSCNASGSAHGRVDVNACASSHAKVEAKASSDGGNVSTHSSATIVGPKHSSAPLMTAPSTPPQCASGDPTPSSGSSSNGTVQLDVKNDQKLDAAQNWLPPAPPVPQHQATSKSPKRSSLSLPRPPPMPAPPPPGWMNWTRNNWWWN